MIIRHYIANYNQRDYILRNFSHTKVCHIALFWHFNADRQTEALKTSMCSRKTSFTFNLDESLVTHERPQDHLVAPCQEMPYRGDQTNSDHRLETVPLG